MTQSSLHVRILANIDSVSATAWDSLAIPSDSPFIEYTWLKALEEAGCVGGESGWFPQHVAIFRGTDLVAAAPAYLKTNSEGEFVHDWSWADVSNRLGIPYFPKLVVGVPFTPATGTRVLVAPGENRGEMVALLGEALRRRSSDIGASSVHVLFPDDAEASLWSEAAGFRRRLGFQFHWRNQGYASIDDFLARFNAKKRHQLRREMSQPAKDFVKIRSLPAEALDNTDLRDAMFAFYVSTIQNFSWGRQYLTRGFFDLVCDRWAHRLAWVVAERDGVPVAGAFNVRKDTKLYGRYWGTRIELPFLHFNVCYYHGIQQCIAEGLDTFEPGAGGEHKHVRGFLPAETHSAHLIHDTRLARLVYPFLEREAEAVRAHLALAAESAPLRMDLTES